MAIFRRGSLTWGKNRNFRPIFGFRIDQCWTVDGGVRLQHLAAEFVDGGKRRTKLYASMLYHRKLRRYTPKTTEQNLIVRIGKREAEVTIIKDCARGVVLLKLQRDTKHRAASLQQQSYSSSSSSSQ